MRGALSDDAVWRLSVAYIGPKSRTERPRKTKIGTEVAHVTGDSDATFRVKRNSRSRSRGRFTHRGVYASGSCSGDRGNEFTVGTYVRIHVAVRRGRLGGARRFGVHRAERRGAGAYCGGSRTACYTKFWILVTHSLNRKNLESSIALPVELTQLCRF